MSKEAMKLALEALENSIDLVSHEAREAEKMYANVPTRLARVQGLVAFEVAHEKAITALREALAQQALDKMAENARELGLGYEPARDSGIVTAGGADPRTQRTWVGLTNDEVNEFAAGCHLGNSVQGAIYKAVAKLKENNT